MIEAIIFDMDGVLVDSELLKAEIWKRILEDYGIENGDKWYIQKFGMSGRELCEIAKKEFLLPDSSTREILQRLLDEHKKLSEENIKPINSSLDFLRLIEKEDVKIGLASSNKISFIIKQLKKLGIYSYFDCIISGWQVKHGKPHPGIYLLAAGKLDIESNRCVAIEDSKSGVESAKNAGMRCIGYKNKNSGNQDLSRADLIVDDLSKLNIQEVLDLE